MLLHAHQVVFALNTALGAEGPLWVQSRLFDNVRAMSAIIPIAADAACRRRELCGVPRSPQCRSYIRFPTRKVEPAPFPRSS